ncbi:MAG: cytochrome c peroxidase [bacterium]
MRGTQVIERLDRLTGSAAGTLVEAGYAVDGLALSADDRWLFADASLSREVRIWDVSDLRAVPRPAFRVPTVEAEPLAPEVLRGKQLFNDSADPRLSRDGYIACAHCHLDGDHDRLVWDFTARGEGLRNTISLLGRAGRAPIHWSGNFDEVQDFEHDIRGPFGGTGLLSDADFAAASTPLGPPKAGLSADLDAMAAYVASLDTPRSSPFRLPDRRLSVAAQRGAALFDDLGCGVCHAGPDYTDSAFTAPASRACTTSARCARPRGSGSAGPCPASTPPRCWACSTRRPICTTAAPTASKVVLRDRNPAAPTAPPPTWTTPPSPTSCCSCSASTATDHARCSPRAARVRMRAFEPGGWTWGAWPFSSRPWWSSRRWGGPCWSPRRPPPAAPRR